MCNIKRLANTTINAEVFTQKFKSIDEARKAADENEGNEALTRNNDGTYGLQKISDTLENENKMLALAESNKTDNFNPNIVEFKVNQTSLRVENKVSEFKATNYVSEVGPKINGTYLDNTEPVTFIFDGKNTKTTDLNRFKNFDDAVKAANSHQGMEAITKNQDGTFSLHRVDEAQMKIINEKSNNREYNGKVAAFVTDTVIKVNSSYSAPTPTSLALGSGVSGGAEALTGNIFQIIGGAVGNVMGGDIIEKADIQAFKDFSQELKAKYTSKGKDIPKKEQAKLDKLEKKYEAAYKKLHNDAYKHLADLSIQLKDASKAKKDMYDQAKDAVKEIIHSVNEIPDESLSAAGAQFKAQMLNAASIYQNLLNEVPPNELKIAIAKAMMDKIQNFMHKSPEEQNIGDLDKIIDDYNSTISNLISTLAKNVDGNTEHLKNALSAALKGFTGDQINQLIYGTDIVQKIQEQRRAEKATPATQASSRTPAENLPPTQNPQAKPETTIPTRFLPETGKPDDFPPKDILPGPSGDIPSNPDAPQNPDSTPPSQDAIDFARRMLGGMAIPVIPRLASPTSTPVTLTARDRLIIFPKVRSRLDKLTQIHERIRKVDTKISNITKDITKYKNFMSMLENLDPELFKKAGKVKESNSSEPASKQKTSELVEKINKSIKKGNLLLEQFNNSKLAPNSNSIVTLLVKFREIIHELDISISNLNKNGLLKTRVDTKFSKELKENRDRWKKLDEEAKAQMQTFKESKEVKSSGLSSVAKEISTKVNTNLKALSLLMAELK